MKINKRVLSICLAVMLVAALAIPASAQTIWQNGEYDGCRYAISAECDADSCYSVIEYQDSDSGNETDYIFQVSMQVCVYSYYEAMYYCVSGNSFASYTLASQSYTSDDMYLVVDHGSFQYRINGDQVAELTVYA